MGEIPKIVKEIKGIQFFITSNGGAIFDKNKKLIYSDTIRKETAEAVMEILGNYRCLIDLYIDGNAYVSKSDFDNIEKYKIGDGFVDVLKSSRIVVNDILDVFIKNKENVEKINLFFEDEDERQEAILKLSKLIPSPHITYSMGNNLEINSETCCKGQGVYYLRKKLGISEANTMTIGDSNNDITMLESAGYSVAMGNAPDNVKEKAVYVTDSCYNNGASKAIKKYALNK